MTKRRVLKVFISSPGDVRDAREEAVRQVQKLNDDPDISTKFLLEIMEWTENTPPIAGRPAQKSVNEYTGLAARADIVICIFGRWFGTESYLGGQLYPSGTYYELYTAEQARRRNRGVKPVILLYHMLKDAPPEQSETEREQAQKVEDFFHTFQWQDTAYQGLFEEYSETERFGAALAGKLKLVILHEFPKQNVGTWFQSVANRFGFGINRETSRASMIHKVRYIWIDGVLNDLTARVAAPFETQLFMGNMSGSTEAAQPASVSGVSNEDQLRILFDHADHQLLILGQPGAGKTFKLLELTSALLDRAEENNKVPIPVVFNLSSWAGRKESIADWLVSELVSVYRLPYKLAREWVDNGKLALCLDGLDEITVGGARSSSDQEDEARRLREECRRECLQALNAYIKGGIWMALCCREKEYAMLETKLQTRLDEAHTTITIAPLSDAQVEAYLDASKWELQSLRQAMADDSTLREMARTPFLLTAMAIAYRDEQAVSAKGIIEGGKGGTEARLRDLFEKYVRVRCHGADPALAGRYTLPDIRHYLGELAQKMEEGDSKLLLVEQLQPDWLPSSSRWKYIALVSLFLFLFMSIFIGLPSGGAMLYEWTSNTGSITTGLYYGFVCALATALCCGGILAAGFAFSKTWGFGVAAGLTLGVARAIITGISRNEGGWSASLRVGLISSVMGIAVLAPLMKQRCHTRDEIIPLESRKWDTSKALLGIVAAFSVGGVFWAAFGQARGIGFTIGLMPILALAFGNLGTNFEVKAYPNQGIRQSAAIAMRICLFSGLAGMICFGASYGVSLGFERGWAYGLQQGIVNSILGLTLAACSLGFGAMPLIQHISLRWVLAARHLAPLKLVDFLNAASDLHLLRRVGGSYMFQHEYLRNYFRALHSGEHY